MPRKPRTLWKVKREGKAIGSWYFTLPGGKRVNTHTSDATKAEKIRARALEKHAAQKRAVEGAADTPLAALDEPGADQPTSEAPPADPVPAASSPPAPGRSPPLLPPIQPDGYAPPSPAPDAGDWTEDAARAAAGAGAPPPEAPQIDPAFLDQIIEQGAALAVELQILAQGFVIKRGLKVKPGPVADSATGRATGTKLWTMALKAMLPTNIDAPPWLVAIIVTASVTVPVQLKGAEPLPKEEQKSGSDPLAQTDDGVRVAA